MVDSVVVVDALTRYTLQLSVCDLKAARMNMQRSLIRELMIYEFELDHNTAVATKNIGCVNSESAVDHSTNQMVEKICLGCKKLNDQARTDRPKFVDSEAVLQVIEANPVSSSQRIRHLTVQCDWSPLRPCQKHPELLNCTSHVFKILQNF